MPNRCCCHNYRCCFAAALTKIRWCRFVDVATIIGAALLQHRRNRYDAEYRWCWIVAAATKRWYCEVKYNTLLSSSLWTSILRSCSFSTVIVVCCFSTYDATLNTSFIRCSWIPSFSIDRYSFWLSICDLSISWHPSKATCSVRKSSSRVFASNADVWSTSSTTKMSWVMICQTILTARK